MGTIQPRARGGSSLRDELKANRKDREQIRRQRVAMPKPAVPVVAGGGGIVGVAEVQSQPGCMFLSDMGGFDKYLVTYDAPFDYQPGAFPVSASSFCEVSGNIIYLAVGTYMVSCRVEFGWPVGSGAPSAVQCGLSVVGHPTDGMHGGQDTLVPTVTTGTGTGISTILNFGPTVIVNADDFLWVETSAGSAPNAGAAATGVNRLPGLHWTIWKMG